MSEFDANEVLATNEVDFLTQVTTAEKLENEYTSNDKVVGAVGKGGAKISFVAKAMIASIMATALVVASVVSGASNYLAQFLHLTAYATAFEYEISVTMDYNVEEGGEVDFSTAETGLFLVVSSGDYSDTIPLQVSENNYSDYPVADELVEEGLYKVTYNFISVVENLEAGTTYTLQIVSIDGDTTTVHAESEIETLAEDV